MLRVLLAEDDAIVAMLLAELLGSLGHEVCAIEATEAELVYAARRTRPDLMIVDAQLGAGSGITGVEAVLGERQVAHMFMSGGPVAAPPGTVVLEKPFSDGDLVRAIDRALAAAESGRQCA
jgi:CheY-like chemotaxis protein